MGRVLQDDDGTIPPTFEYDEQAVLASLAGSRERIGVDRIDVVHVHGKRYPTLPVHAAASATT